MFKKQKQKRKISGISTKDQFRTTEVTRVTSFAKKSIVKLFNFE